MLNDRVLEEDRAAGGEDAAEHQLPNKQGLYVDTKKTAAATNTENEDEEDNILRNSFPPGKTAKKQKNVTFESNSNGEGLGLNAANNESSPTSPTSPESPGAFGTLTSAKYLD